MESLWVLCAAVHCIEVVDFDVSDVILIGRNTI